MNFTIFFDELRYCPGKFISNNVLITDGLKNLKDDFKNSSLFEENAYKHDKT